MTMDDKRTGLIKKLIVTGQFNRFIIYLSVAIPSSIFIVMALLIQLEVLQEISVGPIKIGTVSDFIIFAFFIGTGVFGVYEYLRLRRVRKIDERFPDFVRDLAESRRAGMTFTKAILYASKGNYGVLTSEIKKISQQISWGSSVEEALAAFSKRVNTKLINRTVSLIIEASRSGGSVSDVLDAASRDSREIRLLERERRASMMAYVTVIYVGMGVFLLIIAVLGGSFIPAMTGQSSTSLQSGTLGGAGGIDQDSIMNVFFVTTFFQGIGMGIVTGVFEEGSAVSGIKHVFIMCLIIWVVFKFIMGV